MPQNRTMQEKNLRVKKWDIKNRKMMEDMRSASGNYFDSHVMWFANHRAYSLAANVAR